MIELDDWNVCFWSRYSISLAELVVGFGSQTSKRLQEVLVDLVGVDGFSSLDVFGEVRDFRIVLQVVDIFLQELQVLGEVVAEVLLLLDAKLALGAVSQSRRCRHLIDRRDRYLCTNLRLGHRLLNWRRHLRPQSALGLFVGFKALDVSVDVAVYPAEVLYVGKRHVVALEEAFEVLDALDVLRNQPCEVVV